MLESSETGIYESNERCRLLGGRIFETSNREEVAEVMLSAIGIQHVNVPRSTE